MATGLLKKTFSCGRICLGWGHQNDGKKVGKCKGKRVERDMGHNGAGTGLLGQGQVAAGSGTDRAGTCGRGRKK